MKNTDIIPLDSTEIDHVIYLLRRELNPENRKLVREGEMRGYDIAPRLRDALAEAGIVRRPQKPKAMLRVVK